MAEWLKDLTPVQAAYLNSYRQLQIPGEWTEINARVFFVILAGGLIAIIIWFFWLIRIEVILQMIKLRQSGSFLFIMLTCGRYKDVDGKPSKFKDEMSSYFADGTACDGDHQG